jgi:hypothetical protein
MRAEFDPFVGRNGAMHATVRDSDESGCSTVRSICLAVPPRGAARSKAKAGAARGVQLRHGGAVHRLPVEATPPAQQWRRSSSCAAHRRPALLSVRVPSNSPRDSSINSTSKSSGQRVQNYAGRNTEPGGGGRIEGCRNRGSARGRGLAERSGPWVAPHPDGPGTSDR